MEMLTMTIVLRIQSILESVCPIDGFQYDIDAQTISNIAFREGSTAQQRTNALNAAASFDWSPAAHTTWQNLQDRSALLISIIPQDLPAKRSRALMLLLLDELNLHALKINAILDAVDGAASLAALKTAVALIPDYPARTKQQLLTTLTNIINAGGVDA